MQMAASCRQWSIPTPSNHYNTVRPGKVSFIRRKRANKLSHHELNLRLPGNLLLFQRMNPRRLPTHQFCILGAYCACDRADCLAREKSLPDDKLSVPCTIVLPAMPVAAWSGASESCMWGVCVWVKRTGVKPKSRTLIRRPEPGLS